MKCNLCPRIQAIEEDWGMIKKNGKLLVLCPECLKKEEAKQDSNHNKREG